MRLRKTLTLVAVVAVAGACNRAPAAPPGGQAMPPTPVVLTPARLTPIEDTTEYVASLKSLRSTTIQPQIDGQITKIMVSAGDRVRQGAALMQIDARRQQAAVSSQQAELAAAEATVAYARLFRFVDGAWTSVDRFEHCDAGEIPDDIWELVCNAG